MGPPRFERVLQNAVDDSIIAGASLAAVYKTSGGTVETYLKPFGRESLEEDASDMKDDSLLWVASCTKLLTTIAVLQLVEKGILTLDGPLDKFLPEFATPIPVLLPSTSPSSPPILTSTLKPITLRHLLTHTSGLIYEFPGSIVALWRASLTTDSPNHVSAMSEPDKRNIQEQYLTPLAFAPGAHGKWQYGPGLDWAGKIVERANPENLSLEDYMLKQIWTPLNMKSTTFRPFSRGDLKVKLVPRVQRESNGSISADPMERHPHAEQAEDWGGSGIYTTAQDYIEVLKSLMLDDGKLLSSLTITELFRSQIPASDDLQTILARQDDAISLIAGSSFESSEDMRWNFGLGGLLALDAINGKVGAGSMLWSGLPNCLWWIDREHGTAGFYGSQMSPPGDEISAALYGEFQKGIYAMAL